MAHSNTELHEVRIDSGDEFQDLLGDTNSNLRLLTYNFSSDTPPTNPIPGKRYFHRPRTGFPNGSLDYWNGSAWVVIPIRGLTLADGVLENDQIRSFVVGGDGGIAANRVISGGTVGTTLLVNEVVSNRALADNSVSTDKLKDGSVTDRKLAAQSVSLYDDNSIGSEALHRGFFTGDNFGGSIPANKLAPDAQGVGFVKFTTVSDPMGPSDPFFKFGRFLRFQYSRRPDLFTYDVQQHTGNDGLPASSPPLNSPGFRGGGDSLVPGGREPTTEQPVPGGRTGGTDRNRDIRTPEQRERDRANQQREDLARQERELVALQQVQAAALQQIDLLQSAGIKGLIDTGLKSVGIGAGTIAASYAGIVSTITGAAAAGTGVGAGTVAATIGISGVAAGTGALVGVAAPAVGAGLVSVEAFSALSRRDQVQALTDAATEVQNRIAQLQTSIRTLKTNIAETDAKRAQETKTATLDRTTLATSFVGAVASGSVLDNVATLTDFDAGNTQTIESQVTQSVKTAFDTDLMEVGAGAVRSPSAETPDDTAPDALSMDETMETMLETDRAFSARGALSGAARRATGKLRDNVVREGTLGTLDSQTQADLDRAKANVEAAAKAAQDKIDETEKTIQDRGFDIDAQGREGVGVDRRTTRERLTTLRDDLTGLTRDIALQDDPDEDSEIVNFFDTPVKDVIGEYIPNTDHKLFAGWNLRLLLGRNAFTTDQGGGKYRIQFILPWGLNPAIYLPTGTIIKPFRIPRRGFIQLEMIISDNLALLYSQIVHDDNSIQKINGVWDYTVRNRDILTIIPATEGLCRMIKLSA